MSNSVRMPRWVLALIGAGLVAGIVSFYLAGDWRDGDVSLYHAYALGFWGALGHPLFPTEYPPLSILPMSLTLAGPSDWYPDVFAFWMATLAVLGYIAFRRWASADTAASYVAYIVAAGIATVAFRYDLFPALFSVAALWLAQRHRFAGAYLLLAVATLLKLYPALLLPAVVVAQWQASDGSGRSAWREVAAGTTLFVATVAVVTVASGLIDPHGWSSALRVAAERPIEVESVPATLITLGSLIGLHATPVVSFDSLNITSGLSSSVAILADVALIAGVVWVYGRQLLGRFTTGQAFMAVILVLLCTSKVLSAQYLIWLAPIAAATVGFRMRWLVLFLLTALVFPTLLEVGLGEQSGSVTYSPVFLLGIGVRNGFLLALAGRYLLHPGTDTGDLTYNLRRRRLNSTAKPHRSASVGSPEGSSA